MRSALWMREAPPAAGLGWRERAIVAMARAEGRDLTGIGLIRHLAERTIMALADVDDDADDDDEPELW